MTFFQPLDKPDFVNLDSDQKVFELIEGESAALNLATSANPPEIQHRWYREDGRAVDQSRFQPDASFLNISIVRRTDVGIYRIEAQNSIGTKVSKIELKIKCKSLSLFKVESFAFICQDSVASNVCTHTHTHTRLRKDKPHCCIWRLFAKFSTHVHVVLDAFVFFIFSSFLLFLSYLLTRLCREIAFLSMVCVWVIFCWNRCFCFSVCVCLTTCARCVE